MSKKMAVAFIVVLGFLGGCSNDPDQMDLHGWTAGSTQDGYGTILHTEDGGETWVRQGNSAMIPDVILNDVSAVDEDIAWVVGAADDGYGTILRTTDAGETWVRQGSSSSIPDAELSSVSAVNKQIAWIIGTWITGDVGVVLKTSDGGSTWTQQAQSMLANIQFETVYAYDENNVWAVGQDNESLHPLIIYSSDGGDSWAKQGESDLPDTCGLIGVHAASLNTVWVVGTEVAYLSTDGGSTWTDRSTSIGIGHNNGVCAVSEQAAWIAADYSQACFTSDAGETWIYQNTPTKGTWPVNTRVTAVDQDTVWMISRSAGSVLGQIFHTADGGDNWAEQFSSADTYMNGISFAGALR
jgi:photosystem II stability/assembly factor-like uncharacterized protein